MRCDLKRVQPRKIFIVVGEYSPSGDKKYFDSEKPFLPDITVYASESEAYIHVWKKGEEYFYAFEIYPLHFKSYPDDTDSVGVQHVTVITEEEYLEYKNLPFNN
jgi:hypothetical protein